MSAPSSPLPRFRDTWRRLLAVAGAEAPRFRRAVAWFSLAAVAQGLAFSCLFPLFDALLGPAPDPAPDWGRVVFWLLAMVALAAADLVLSWKGHGFEYDGTIADVTHALRLDLGQRLRGMPMEILARHRTGTLSATLGSHIDEVVVPMGTLSQVMIRTLGVPLTVIGVTALCIDVRLALALALIFPLAVPLYRHQHRLAARERRDGAAAHARVEADLIEYTQGLAVLRAVGQTGARAQRLRASLATLRQVQRDALMASLWPALLMSGLMELGLLAVLGLGLLWVGGGSLSLAAVAALLIIVMRLGEPLALFSELTKTFVLMEAALERIEVVRAARPLPVLPASPRPGPKPDDAPAVAFENVSFTYAGTDTPALVDVGFRLPARTLTALVGPSGSGKSTLTRLLLRHADPQAGVIRLQGDDIRTLAPEALMRRLSVVFQDVHLFNDTILENIRMGRPDASDEAVREAARAAHCLDFIDRLPQGLHTPVGDIGGSLSGGERQRLSIARAILKDAPLVLLDEPTAALDTQSERVVQTAIDALVQDRTVIVIAHRLSTVVGADTVLVFDQGRIVEQGAHADLVAANGPYAALWRAQEERKAWHA
ncbi:ABC transporter ATP-binding protein [Pararhodospirillum oryzae]|uniref:ABC transporter permease n=1 Tax=Pararhodospirillum oryzae TaxID=478448 RepID=A0A512H345_9PROT|nr:ABC transporter ATP-binding protein [Pararhodospirillum oryzae]GEO79874.1 ABC transporter permease [Pararhodospirillum oryzae]